MNKSKLDAILGVTNCTVTFVPRSSYIPSVGERIWKVAKPILVAILLLGLMLYASIPDAKAEGAPKTIPIIGLDVNHKYPVYDLEGDLTDLTYFSGDYVYRSGDLFSRMKDIKKEDVNHNGYVCEFICKDSQGAVVGLNPEFRHIAK